MIVTNPHRRSRASVAALSAACLALGFAAPSTRAANYYFDVNGATAGSGVTDGGSYSWEDPNWNNNVSAGNVATINYVDGNFPRFSAGTDATGSYTITLNADHSTLGMIQEDAAVGATLTFTGTGKFGIAGGVAQGIITRGGDTVKFLDEVTGNGGVNFQTSGGTGNGSLYLYGHNTYTVGTVLATAGTLNFNNNDSFGTGPIYWNNAAPAIAFPDATAPITIANAMNTVTPLSVATNATSASSRTLTVAGPGAFPVTFSGPVTLSPGFTSTFTVGNGAFTDTVATLSGNITGATANLAKAGTGTLVLSGTANSFTGTTTVSAGVLRLAAPNAIAPTTGVILGGGTLDPDALTQAMTSAPLGLTANSTIDFSAGHAEIDFANSSAQSWTGTLNLLNFDPGVDTLRFGTDATGLTTDQINAIQFSGATPANLHLDSTGALSTAVPEPTAAALLLLAAPLTLAPRRRHHRA